MKFVNMSSKGAEGKARLHLNHDKKSEAPMNPPRVKKDRFAPQVKEPAEPVRIRSPVKSAIRGDVKEEPLISNSDILAFLKANLKK
jgi:hypothetical protein